MKVKRPDIEHPDPRYDLDQTAEGHSPPNLADKTFQEPSVRQAEVDETGTPEIGIPVSPAKLLSDFKSPWVIFSGLSLTILAAISYMKLIASKTPLSTMQKEPPRPSEKKNNNPSIFVTTHLFGGKGKVDKILVATQQASKIDKGIQSHMIGEVVTILNEAQGLVLVEVF